MCQRVECMTLTSHPPVDSAEKIWSLCAATLLISLASTEHAADDCTLHATEVERHLKLGTDLAFAEACECMLLRVQLT